MKFDLICIIPLFGYNCGRVASRMCASLASIVTTKKIKIVFIYDKTVSIQSLLTILQIMQSVNNKNLSTEIIFSDKTSSGYKRNLGIEKYHSQCKLIWLLDQDDWLLPDYFDEIIDIAQETIDAGNPCIMIPFQRPVLDHILTNIDSVMTMPWQYIYDPEVAIKYKFDETIEMGSDIPFVVGILTDYDLYDPITSHIRAIRFDKPIYYYNYMNNNSESRRVLAEEQRREKEQEEENE